MRMRRRAWLLGALGSGGALVLGWSALPMRSRLGTPGLWPPGGEAIALNGWIAIAPDGSVRLAMPRSEMGQGVHTALAMLVAEELGLPLAAIKLVPAAADAIYGNVATVLATLPAALEGDGKGDTGATAWRRTLGRWFLGKVGRELGLEITGGSTSVVDGFDLLRLAGATVRAQLLGAAALRWRLPVEELRLADGQVSHGSGASLGIGALAAAAAATPVSNVQPKPRGDWTLIGHAPPRIDLPAKVDGSAGFGIDVRLPGMVYAVVRMCPMLGGSPGRVDVDAGLRQPGVERVVRLGPYAGTTCGVAVIGRSFWHAQRAAQALAIDWQPPPAVVPDTRQIEPALAEAARGGAGAAPATVFHARGDVDAAAAGAARRIEALYQVPYLAHAAMEPINCTAQVRDSRVEVWVSTQVPGFVRALAAQVAGVPQAAVTVHVSYVGGGFGRRLEADVAGQAVRVALETGGRPVQLIWPREEDLRHDCYRPAGAAWMEAWLDGTGLPLALRITTAGDAVNPRWSQRNMPGPGSALERPDAGSSAGLTDLPYAIAHQHIAHRATHHGVPVGYWRSVGHSQNAFFAEAFVDELAQAAGQDPLAFRLALLAGRPRHVAVLQLAAQRAGWGRPPPTGRALGLALHASFGSIVALVLEVSLEAATEPPPAGAARQGPPLPEPRVHRAVCAVDCGTVVHPGIVAQQMEGALLFGLSAALYGRIDVDAGVVRQGNYDSFRQLRLARCPVVETHIVPGTEAPGGAGEPGTPPAAPALANALFALTGRRWRRLPLVPMDPSTAA